MNKKSKLSITSVESVKRQLIKIVISNIREHQRQVEYLKSQDVLFKELSDDDKVARIEKQTTYLYNLMNYLKRFIKEKPYVQAPKEVLKREDADALMVLAERIHTEDYDKSMCSEWEIKFMMDIDDKLTKYGERTMFSQKQKDKILQILNRRSDE